MAKKKQSQGTEAPGQATPPSPPSDFEQTKSERRLKDVGAARSVYERLTTDNLLRSNTFAQVRNQLEGGRPFDPNDLEANGATWQTNVNFGDARSARDRTLLPYWKMVNDVPHKIAVTMESNSPQSEQWQVAFAEAFDSFLDDWGADYFIQYMNMANNFVNFGPGIVQWTEKDNPRFKAVNVQRIVWPKNARMAPEEWELWAFVRDVSAAELYLKIKDGKARNRSEYAGWNITAVEKAITYYKDGNFTPDPRDYTRWQDMLVNNDLMVSSIAEPLQLVYLFFRQFDGKIGCYVFCQQGGVDDFLFKDEVYSESPRHILGCVWYDTGVDSMIHSIKGFGIKNYYYSTLINRTKSRFVDAATMVLGVNFQRDSDNIPDETPPVENYGPYTIFPPGIQQLNVYPQIQQAMGVIGMLEQNAAQNNSLYSEQKAQIEETDTATQAKILAAMQGEMTEASASIYLAQVGENIFAEQVRKLRIRGSTNEDAKKFVARLKAKGVPEEVIYDAEIRVRTGASAGMASAAVREMKFSEGLALSQIPGVNQRWFLENLIANRYGSQAVGKALLPEGQKSKPMQRRQAMMENNDFGSGQPLPVAPEDAHVEHAEEHLTPLMGIAGKFQQSGQLSPEEITAITIGTEHLGEHMAYISRDESQKGAFQALNPMFRQVASLARGILTRVSQQPNNPNAPSAVALAG